MMSDIGDVDLLPDDDGSLSPVSPYGRASSNYVRFSGPGIEGLDLAPIEEEDEDQAKTVASSSTSSLPRELGDDGAVWFLSSAKFGNGVEQLRDSDPNTFWQSDGLLPHAITIQFQKMTRVSHVCLYLDQKLDESYTPSRISIRVGNGSASVDVTHDGQPFPHGIREMDKFEIEEPQGWLVCHLTRPVGDINGDAGDDAKSSSSSSTRLAPVRCHFVQVVILNSHQNGRDTHIRQVKIFGPRQAATNRGLLAEVENFTSTEFKQFSMLR